MKVVTEGERIYLDEQTAHGSSLGYMRLSTIASATVACVAIIGFVWAVASSGQRHAYIVRIDPDGRYETVAEGIHFKRQPSEVSYFIRQFCEHYFSRSPFAANALKDTKYYFDPSVRPEVEEAWRQAKVFENMASAGAAGVQVHAVATGIQLSSSGDEAYVQVRLDRRVPGQPTEDQTMTSTHIRFTCLACDGKTVPNEISAVNPLGFLIQNIPMLEVEK